MSDPTGTIGAQANVSNDLAWVAEGGSTFMSRMKALTDLREQQEAAYVQLKLGTDAQAALDRAKQQLADADALKADAVKVRDAAVAQANQITEEASRNAAATMAAAEASAKAAIDAADAKVKAATKLSDDITSASATLQKQTAAANANAKKLEKDALDRVDQLKSAQEATEQLRQQTEALKADLQSRIERLSAVIAEVSGG